MVLHQNLLLRNLFKVTIDNLSPGVVYDIFPFATNSDGMASGDTLQISTEGFEAPVVKTFDVTDGMFGADWVLLSGLVENKDHLMLRNEVFVIVRRMRNQQWLIKL